MRLCKHKKGFCISISHVQSRSFIKLNKQAAFRSCSAQPSNTRVFSFQIMPSLLAMLARNLFLLMRSNHIRRSVFMAHCVLVLCSKRYCARQFLGQAVTVTKKRQNNSNDVMRKIGQLCRAECYLASQFVHRHLCICQEHNAALPNKYVHNSKSSTNIFMPKIYFGMSNIWICH